MSATSNSRTTSMSSLSSTTSSTTGSPYTMPADINPYSSTPYLDIFSAAEHALTTSGLVVRAIPMEDEEITFDGQPLSALLEAGRVECRGEFNEHRGRERRRA